MILASSCVDEPPFQLLIIAVSSKMLLFLLNQTGTLVCSEAYWVSGSRHAYCVGPEEGGGGGKNTQYVFEKELTVRESQYDTLPHCIISLDMFVMLCHCVLTFAHNYTMYGTSINYVMSPCHTTEGFCDFEIPIRDLKVDFTEVKI